MCQTMYLVLLEEDGGIYSSAHIIKHNSSLQIVNATDITDLLFNL